MTDYSNMSLTQIQAMCKVKDCTAQRVGNSKYCAHHKKIARDNWKERIAQESAERQSRYAEFQKIYDLAYQAMIDAGNGHEPTPMVVSQHASPLNDNSPVVKSYYVPSGVCGFAWVHIFPGNSSFAKWLIKNDLAYTAYEGGVKISIREFGQSYEKKLTGARAMATALEQIKAVDPRVRGIYPGGRLD